MNRKLYARRLMNRLSTMQTIVLGFMLVIFLGSVLLTLPIASRDGVTTSYIDALFTATSSVCVTGLVTVTTMVNWSIFGKVVILILIQIGGLGFMTALTLVFSVLKRKMSVKNRLSTQDALNESGISSIGYTVKRVVFGTFIIEAIGALLLTIALLRNYEFLDALKYGIFTAISAFCNAGIDIMSMDSLISYNTNGLLIWTVMGLIVIGGIGFPVWWEFIGMIRERFKNKIKLRVLLNRRTLHFKVVVVTTFTLIVVGAIIIFFGEFNNSNTIGNMPLVDKLNNSIFQSVTTRTAGFATISQPDLTSSSKVLSLLLMFIGGSPGSTAGGIKTATFAVMIIVLVTWIRSKGQPRVFKRSLPSDLVRRSFLIASLSAAMVFIAIMILTNTEKGSVMSIAFESFSALATVGLSLDFTASLTFIGKIVIICLMFMGRIGPITIFLAMSREKKATGVSLPEEKILVG